MCVEGEHVVYCCGARVRISEKGIEVLTEPLVEYCPLHEALYGTKQIDVKAVRKSVEVKIAVSVSAVRITCLTLNPLSRMVPLK